MKVQSINPAARWLTFAGLVLASSGLIFGAARHGIAEYWANSSTPNQWSRAAQLEPSNAQNWYRIGRYRALDFENADLALAISYYERSVAIDPRSATHWLDLAWTYEEAGQLGLAERAYRRAQEDYPISADVAWRFGNFLLRQSRTQEAFLQMQRAVSADSKLTELAVSVCWRSTHDIDQIVKFALPAKPDVYWGAIEFFTRAEEPGPAVVVWKRLVADESSFAVSMAFPLFDLLIRSGDVDDARLVWQQALSAAGIVSETTLQSGLVWDGGFERELLNGGFAWRYRQVAGADMDLDEETFHSGRRSLRIVFDGTSNLDFANIWQDVPVEPATRYRFSAYIRTQDVTTDSGIRFQIDQDPIPPQSTSNIIGTQPWSLADVEFSTGPETHLIHIVLRRKPSERFGNKIRGTVWVDDVSLVQVPVTRPDGR